MRVCWLLKTTLLTPRLKINIAKLKMSTRINDFEIISAWTQAGMGSCIHIKGTQKDEDILFDLGLCEPSSTSAKFVFISHSHIDHIGCAIIHARMKTLQSSPATYYMPSSAVKALKEAHAAYEMLDESKIIMDIKPCDPGDIIHISNTLSVRVFSTLHRVPSQGYAVYKTKKGILLPEYRDKSPQEIGRLRQSGVVVKSSDTQHLQVVYTGKTNTKFNASPVSHNDHYNYIMLN